MPHILLAGTMPFPLQLKMFAGSPLRGLAFDDAMLNDDDPFGPGESPTAADAALVLGALLSSPARPFLSPPRATTPRERPHLSPLPMVVGRPRSVRPPPARPLGGGKPGGLFSTPGGPPTVLSILQEGPADPKADAKRSRGASRGGYRCKRCGLPKKGHGKHRAAIPLPPLCSLLCP